MAQGDDILREIVGYNLSRVNSAMLSRVAQVLVPFGLRRVTYSALAVIHARPQLRQSDLASALAIEKANMGLIVIELENAGLVSKSRSAADRRAYALHVTPAGQALYQKADAAIRTLDQTLTTGLDPAERRQLITLLRKIETNAEKTEVSYGA